MNFIFFFAGLLLAILTVLFFNSGPERRWEKRWQKCLKDARRIVQQSKEQYPGCENALAMFLEQRFNTVNPANFNISGSTILGTSPSTNLERTWPYEEIMVNVLFTVTTALAPTVAGTPDTFDGILNLVQRLNLSINDGIKPRSVVDISGVGLLEHLTQTGFNLDTGNNVLIGMVASGANIPTGSYQLSYRLPMVNPMIGEGLRSRMYLPAHKFTQDPVLKLTFNTLSQMGYGSGVIGSVFVELMLIRRVPTAESEAALQKDAPSDQRGIFRTGYIPWDLLETSYVLPIGSAADVQLEIPQPGQYLSMVFRQYKGGSAITRNVVDFSGIGDSVANGLGSETKWRMEVSGGVVREWRWRQLRTINDQSRPPVANPQSVFVAATSAGSPTTAVNNQPNFGAVISGNLRAACSTSLNFLLDGMSGDTGTELGSLLDTNTPNLAGAKTKLIGTPASVATNASQIQLVGHRLFGDLSNWQRFA